MIKIRLERIKQLTAVQFGYQPYFDEFNHYRLIKPKNSNKVLDKFLNPYADEVHLKSHECPIILSHLKNIDMGKPLNPWGEQESKKMKEGIRTLKEKPHDAEVNELSVIIDNLKEEFIYVC